LRKIRCSGWILALTLFLSSVAALARAESTIKVEWQPISEQDLALKDNPAAPGADAMILYREVVIDQLEHSMTEYVRIKIFTEKGRDWGDVQIPYAPIAWQIKDLRARTIRGDGSIVEFHGEVFDEVTVKLRAYKYRRKKFSLTEVQAGSIVEYMYRRQYEFFGTPPSEWTVQGELFTRLGVFLFRPSMEAGLAWREHGLPAGLGPQKQKDGSYRLELHDFPGVVEEEWMPPKKLVTARVGFFNRFAPFKANATAEGYWHDAGKLWGERVDKFIGKKDFLEQVVAQTVLPDDAPETKLRKLFARAQQIHNLDFAPEENANKRGVLKANETAADVVKHGYGTSSQINYLFTGLARAAGFQASPVYVAPRDEDFFSPNLQDAEQLTVDVVYIRLGARELYLDPGEPYFPFGLLPWYESEVRGVRLEPDGGVITVTTPPVSSDATLLRDAELQIDADGSAVGKLRVEFRGQRGCVRREENREKSDPGRQQDLTDEVKDWLQAGATLEDVAVTGWENTSAPLRLEATLRIPDYGALATDRILLPVTIFRNSQTRLFRSATRVNPIYFSFPYQEEDEITWKLPAGYGVEALAPGAKTPTSLVGFELTARSDGATIHVHRKLVVDAYSFPVTAYPSLRTFFQTAASADEQQIALRRERSSHD
jgi:Domain of Unknown Function with PDB structure (DUF3857)